MDKTLAQFAPAEKAPTAPTAPAAALFAALRDIDSLPDDALVSSRVATALLGSICKSGHFIRRLADRGLVEVVRLSERDYKYRLGSIRRLVRGKAST